MTGPRPVAKDNIGRLYAPPPERFPRLLDNRNRRLGVTMNEETVAPAMARLDEARFFGGIEAKPLTEIEMI